MRVSGSGLFLGDKDKCCLVVKDKGTYKGMATCRGNARSVVVELMR